MKKISLSLAQFDMFLCFKGGEKTGSTGYSKKTHLSD